MLLILLLVVAAYNVGYCRGRVRMLEELIAEKAEEWHEYRRR